MKIVVNFIKALFIFLILTGVSGCKEVDKLNEILQSIQGDLQQKRAISVSEFSMQKIDNLDILIYFSDELLNESSVVNRPEFAGGCLV